MHNTNCSRYNLFCIYDENISFEIIFIKRYQFRKFENIGNMDRQEYLERHIFRINDRDGNNYFIRASFTLPYVGQNNFGSHDDAISVSIYETFSNENINSTSYDEPLLREVLESQVTPGRLPCSLTDPDYYRDLYELRDGNVTHSLWIWDESIPNLDIDLSPVYTLQKAIFVMARMDEIMKLHELHMLVHTRPL